MFIGCVSLGVLRCFTICTIFVTVPGFFQRRAEEHVPTKWIASVPPRPVPLCKTWSGRILTLPFNYVADYTDPLLFLFERTHNYPVDDQGLLPWRPVAMYSRQIQNSWYNMCVPLSDSGRVLDLTILIPLSFDDPNFDALWAYAALYISVHMHIVPNVLPKSLCGWPHKSLYLLEEGQNHPIVHFAYLCHDIGEKFVFLYFLWIKPFGTWCRSRFQQQIRGYSQQS